MGRLFQARGPATDKALSPNDSRVIGTSRVRVSDANAITQGNSLYIGDFDRLRMFCRPGIRSKAIAMTCNRKGEGFAKTILLFTVSHIANSVFGLFYDDSCVR